MLECALATYLAAQPPRWGFVMEYIRCPEEDGIIELISDMFIYYPPCDDESEIIADSKKVFVLRNDVVCLGSVISTYVIESYVDQNIVIDKWIESKERGAIKVDYEWVSPRDCKGE